MAQRTTTGVPMGKPVMLVLQNIDLNSKLALLRDLRGAGYVVLNTPNGIDPGRALGLARNADAGALVLWADEADSVAWIKATVHALQGANLYLPLLVGGPLINEEIAKDIVQTEQGMYIAGVYDYLSTDEVLQILKYIVFYSPPKPAHSHAHEDDACGIEGGCDSAEESACSSCGSACPMNSAQ